VSTDLSSLIPPLNMSKDAALISLSVLQLIAMVPVTMCKFLNNKDAKSTSNLRGHTLKCWGEDDVDAACSLPADGVHE
jgi:hypothetical protein